MLSEEILNELRSKYTPETLSMVLYNALTPIHNEKALAPALSPLFMQGKNHNLLVFPPSTDKPGNGNTLSSIKSLIELAITEASHIQIASKKLVFPISEEQPALGWLGDPRKHWVTLHYDPSTQKAAVIDSRPYINNSLYSLEPLKAELAKGLACIGQVVNNIELYSQQVQLDDVHCGAWTVANIIKLATTDRTLESISPNFTSGDKDNIINSNIAYAEKETYQKRRAEIRQRQGQGFAVQTDEEDDFVTIELLSPAQTNTPDTAGLRSNSSGSSLDSDLYQNCQTPLEMFFSESKKAQWLQNGKDLFWNYIESPQKQLIAIIARENIRLNGDKLSMEYHSEIDVAQMLTELESKYSINPATSEEITDTTGYTFCGHGHPHHKLITIGLKPYFIQSLPLSDAIIYESAISTAESSAGHEEAFVSLAKNHSDTVDIEKASEVKRTFIAELIAYLKEQIIEASKLTLKKRQAASLQVNPLHLQIELLKISHNKREKLAQQQIAKLQRDNNTLTQAAAKHAAQIQSNDTAQVALLQQKISLLQAEKEAQANSFEQQIRQLQQDKRSIETASKRQIAQIIKQANTKEHADKEEIRQFQEKIGALTQASIQQATTYEQRIEALQKQKKPQVEAMSQATMTAPQQNEDQIQLLQQQIFQLQTQKQAETLQQLDHLNESAKPHIASFMNGISFEILGAVMSVMGIAAASMAITALCLGSLGIIPATSVAITGSVLATAGFFSLHQGATANANCMVPSAPQCHCICSPKGP